MSKFDRYTIYTKSVHDFASFEKQRAYDFIKKNHYSGSMCRYPSHLGLMWEGSRLVGVMILGTPVGKHCQTKYAPKGKLIELKRLVMIDRTLKNAESFFIGYTLRWLKKNTTVTHVLSYADTSVGHEGIIYKASNFKFLGQTPPASNCITKHKGKLIPIRTSYNKLHKLYEEIQEGRKKGTTKNIYLKPKNIYVYDLQSRR